MKIIKRILWFFTPCDHSVLEELDKKNEHIKNIQI